MRGPAIRQAVILVGGKGTRLGAITRNIPKPMLPIGGDRPFLDYLLEMIERHGYKDIVLLGGYLAETLEASYDGRRIGDATIRVLREPVPLGTAGALTIARDALDPRFLLMNGDALFDINLRALEQASQQGDALATLALRTVPDASRYGRVIQELGRVVAFMEKDLSQPGPGIINGGVYVLKREILNHIRELPSSLEQDVFPTLVERDQIRGLEFDGYFLDIGLPETLEQGHIELPRVRVRPAAFLDRNVLVNSVTGRLDPTDSAIETVRALNDRGYYVFVMSSQGTRVVGDARQSHQVLQERLAAEGAHVDRFYGESADTVDAGAGLAIEARGRRSTSLFDAMREWPIVSERSFFVNASREGAEAARSAGIPVHTFNGADLSRSVASLMGQSLQAEET